MSSLLTELDIRAIVHDALSDILGTYTYSGGVTQPAFVADDGAYQNAGDPWPNGPEVPKVAGLEVVLEIDVDAPDFQPLMGNDYHAYRQCRVTLKQWTITSTVREASRRLVKALARSDIVGLSVGPRVPRFQRVDNIESQSFTFKYAVQS